MANKMPTNNAKTPSTTVSHRQVRQPNTMNVAIKHDKRYATILENKNTTIFSWDLMELLTDL